jgi:hypothetical protein
MKNLFLSILSILSFSGFSQSILQLDSIHSQKQWYENSPGKELRLYAKHQYTGIALVSIGSIIATTGSITNAKYVLSNPNNTGILSNDSSYNIFSPGGLRLVVGIGTSIVGTILILEAPLHIKRAGIIMDSRGIGLKIKV